MTNIRLSIAIANYNHGRFLQQRISSIMSQMSSRDELIIVDDASTDNSCQIIDEFIRHDDRIKLFRNNQNLGVVKSANRAISESRGEYLASFSVDDVILP